MTHFKALKLKISKLWEKISFYYRLVPSKWYSLVHICTSVSESYYFLDCKNSIVREQKERYLDVLNCYILVKVSRIIHNTQVQTPFLSDVVLRNVLILYSGGGGGGRRNRAPCLVVHASPLGWKQSESPVQRFVLSSNLPHEKPYATPLDRWEDWSLER